jgi:L-2-hydroxyglutarate oxidase LhgO/elongation factor P hydroxylase
MAGLTAVEIAGLFNGRFGRRHRVRLLGGAREPEYQPASDRQPAVIRYTRDYARSALHELAHWCIAGAERRRLRDYGYWYQPPPRNERQLAAFARVECRVQALELLLSEAAGISFCVSVDDVSAQASFEPHFARQVEAAGPRRWRTCWRSPPGAGSSSMADVDCVVIGAGVVGLACARALALAGLDVVVLERHGHVGEETSSRNSEVIHAGIYYPTGSAKARLCLAGKLMLYEFCRRFQVDHRRCGKIIVAADESQRAVLEDYRLRARQNGVGELEPLSAAEVQSLEPNVRCVAGLLSPTTGIVDSHGFMAALRGELERSGAMIAFGTTVTGLARLAGGGLKVAVPGYELSARHVVNSAGLSAPAIARLLDSGAPQAFFARGHYYGYSGPPPFSRLVYPIAEAGGLGVHVTVDLAGQVKFGPDVEWVDDADYRFDDTRRDRFAAAIERYFPALERGRLLPDYVGVRPKITPAGTPAADFRLDDERIHGVPGLMNLLGIESPGLTASLAIAEEVRALITATPAELPC